MKRAAITVFRYAVMIATLTAFAMWCFELGYARGHHARSFEMEEIVESKASR